MRNGKRGQIPINVLPIKARVTPNTNIEPRRRNYQKMKTPGVVLIIPMKEDTIKRLPNWDSGIWNLSASSREKKGTK